MQNNTYILQDLEGEDWGAQLVGIFDGPNEVGIRRDYKSYVVRSVHYTKSDISSSVKTALTSHHIHFNLAGEVTKIECIRGKFPYTKVVDRHYECARQDYLIDYGILSGIVSSVNRYIFEENHQNESSELLEKHLVEVDCEWED